MNNKNIPNTQTWRLIDIEAEEQELHQTISEAISRLTQLGEERLRILTGAKSGIPTLAFDRDGRTIRWKTGEILLGPKAFCFVKALWFAQKRRLRTDQLGQIVWKNEAISSETVRIFLWRMKIRLKKHHFPFEIVQVQNSQTKEIKGFALRVTS